MRASGKAVATALMMAAGTADAAAVFSFRNEGLSVVGTLSGSLDLTGTLPNPDKPFGAQISISFAFLSSGPGTASPEPFLSYSVLGPGFWGIGPLVNGTASGDAVQIMAKEEGALTLPKSYTGGPLSGQIVFPNTILDDFDLAANSFTYRLSGSKDTFTLTFDKQIPPAPIPLPAAFLALLTGLALLAGLARRSAAVRGRQT